MQRNKTVRDWGRRNFNQVKKRAMTTKKNFNRHPAYKIIVVCLWPPLPFVVLLLPVELPYESPSALLKSNSGASGIKGKKKRHSKVL